MAKIDPVTLEIVWTRLVSMVDEAAAAMVRTSFSTIVRESNDYAVVLLDRDCRLLAQSSQSIPAFICTLPHTARHLLGVFRREGLHPGDVLLTNDPWLGTGHLPDLNLVMPIFRNDEVVGFAATVAHAPDIGGRLRSPSNSELYEEGLRIPPAMLVQAGEPNHGLIDIIRANVRVPDQVMGDLWAQVAANRMLARGVVSMLDESGLDLLAIGHEIQERSAGAMRAAIEALPDGDFRYQASVDGFVEPVTLCCNVQVRGDTIRVDYSGSSPQLPRAINVVPIYTFAYSAYALKCVLAPAIPNNEGSFRGISTWAPEGSILNARFPAAVSARAMTGHLIPTVVMGALAGAVPDQVRAAPGSPLWCVHMAGRDPADRFAATFFLNGGMGAGRAGDGPPTLSFPSNLANTPIEVLEGQAPLRVIRRALRRGTGGAGITRGGDGQILEFEILATQPVTISFRADRLRTPAPGLLGGDPGATGRVLLDGEAIDPREIMVVPPGARVRLETPGGGGFGPPPAGTVPS